MNDKTLSQFRKARNQYLQELEDLRKRYAIKFYKILQSEDTDESSRHDKESISAVLH